VENAGPDEAPDVELTDALPASVSFVSASLGCSHGAGTVTCDLGALTSGDSATVEVEVTPDEQGTMTNTASVAHSGADPNSANDSASEETTIEAPPPPGPDEADLTLSKADSPDPAIVGEDLVYTLRVDNNGPDNAAAVEVEDPLPTSVTFTSASAGCTHAAGVITCDLGSIPSGTPKSAEVTVTPETAGTILNAASVSSATDDPQPSNNSAVEETIVEAPEQPGPPGAPARCRHLTTTGTSGSDTLRGTPGADVIHAKGGQDRIRAGGGKDVVCGGRGNDRDRRRYRKRSPARQAGRRPPAWQARWGHLARRAWKGPPPWRRPSRFVSRRARSRSADEVLDAPARNIRD